MPVCRILQEDRMLSYKKLDPVAAYLKCRRAKLVTVEPALLLFLLGRQFFLSLLQQYFFVALAQRYLQEEDDSLSNNSSSAIVPRCLRSSTLSNHSMEVYREVLSESNALVAYSQAANSPAPILLTLLLMPFLDRCGYRLGLILPVCGNIAKGFLMLLVVHYSVDPRWIPAVSFLCSLTGEVVLFVSTSFVYISQVSGRQWVTTRIALGEAAACFGEATGMFLSGFLLSLSDCNYIALLLFFIAINALAILYTIVLLPEALTENERIVNFEERKLCDVFSELHQMFTVSFSKSWRLVILLVYISVSFIMPYGNSLIMLYFLKALPFDFSELRIGIVQSAISYGRSMYNVLLAILSSVVEVSDLGIVLVALLISSISSVVYGVAKEDWEIYTVSVFYGMDVLGWASAEAYMSKLLGQKEQGTLFAVVISIQGVSHIIASLGWPFSMSVAVRKGWPLGLPFFFTAAIGLGFLPFIIFLWITDVRQAKQLNKHSTLSNGKPPQVSHKDHDASPGDSSE